MTSNNTSRIIGIGAWNFHDDGVGPWLAQALAARGLNAVVHTGDDTTLIEDFDTHSDVTLLDATQCGHAPGTITRLDASSTPVPLDVFHHSGPVLGIGEIVETARALGCLPPRLLLIGIEGESFAPGSGLSPKVRAAALQVLEELCAA